MLNVVTEHMTEDQLYAIFRLNSSATEGELTKKYRILVLKYHPDKNKINPQVDKIIRRINDGYHILKARMSSQNAPRDSHFSN